MENWNGAAGYSKEPSRFLSYTFDVIGSNEPPSRVTFEIEQPANITTRSRAVRLTVTHEEFPPDSKVYPDVCEGWPGILSSLKTLLEIGQSLELSWKE